MKKLMVAASAAAISAAVFADVYNVKFTASTLVDAEGAKATRKVKGETEEYYKKHSITVTGVYDDSTGEAYFWTGSGKNMAPLQSAVFEITNETEMDDLKRTDAGKAVSVGLYVGASDNLTSYFVSGGIGKGALNTKNKDTKEWTADLVSASGSFGGTWYGLPAYGSWSFSKNSTATRNGIAAYVQTQGKSAGVTTASWTGTSDIGTALEAYRAAAEEADTVSAMIKQIAVLTGTNVSQASTIAEQSAAIAANEKAIAANEETIARLEATIAANAEEYVDELSTLDVETYVGLTETISDYLKETIAKQSALAAESAAMLESADKAIAEYEEASSEGYAEKALADLVAASNAVAAAEKDLGAKENTASEAYDKLDWLYDVKNGNYEDEYAGKTNTIIETAAEARAAKEAEIEAAKKKYDADIAALKDDNDKLIDVTLPEATNTLVAVTIPGLEDAKEATAAEYEAAVEAQKLADDYLAEYTIASEDGSGAGNYKKFIEDNDLEDSGETRLYFHNVVYPGMKKDAVAAAEATAAAKTADEDAAKDIADANDVLAATIARLDALIAAREEGNLAAEIQKQIDDLTEEYTAKDAELRKELENIGTKVAADLAAAKKAYDDSYSYIHSDESLDQDIADAEKAFENACLAVNEALDALAEAESARDEAESVLADLDGVVKDKAVAVEGIIGVRPDAEGYEEAKEKFFEDWSALNTTTGENVAAAKAILARLGKSVGE